MSNTNYNALTFFLKKIDRREIKVEMIKLIAWPVGLGVIEIN